jgi:oligopeptidase B
MKKQTLILLFATLFALSVKAQNFTTITGKVTEKQSGKAIAYATISIKNQSIGTVTNTEGSFVFHIPVKYKNDSLTVSSIGYKSYAVKISDIVNKKLNIRLEPKVYDLSEVEVKPKNALEIVKQAIAKIPENYPTQPINMDGFYREMTFENDTCVEMAEAACEFYYRPYNETIDLNSAYDTYYKYTESHFDYFVNNIVSLPTNPNDELKVVEGRSSDLFHKNHFIVIPRGGPLSLASYDIVKTKYVLFKNKLLKKFKFNLEDITSYQNKQVYIIAYQSKRKDTNGKIYIDINSLAFIQISINFNKIGKQKYTAYWTPALYKKKRKRCKDLLDNYNQKVIVNYKNIKNKWYLSSIQFNEAFDYIFSKYYINKKDEPEYNYKIDKKLLINNHKTQNVTHFNNKDNFANSFYSILYEQDLGYNPAFWKQYNIVKTTPLQDSIMQQLQLSQNLEEQYEFQFIKNDSLKAPVAKKIPVINPYTKLKDDYFWMQDIKNPDVFKYVEAENKFTTNEMLPLKQLRRSLYSEMLNRIVKDTIKNKIILKHGDYKYFYKKEINKHTKNIYRKNIKTLKEEIVLDINKLSMGNNNYSVDNLFPDAKNKLLAYTESYGLGYENMLILKDIENDKTLAKIENVESVFWKNSGNGFFYTSWNTTNRINRLMYHKVGLKSANDKIIYYEQDKQKYLFTFLYQKRWLILYSEDDYHDGDAYLIDLNAPQINVNKIIDSHKGYIHHIQISNDTLYSLSHENGNSIVYYTPIENPEKENWKILLKKQGDNMRQLLILKDYFVVKEINSMVFTLNIFSKQGVFIKKIDFDKIPNKINLVYNEKVQYNNKFRYTYSSLITPQTFYEYDIEFGKQKNTKQEKFKFKPENYRTKLVWATSKDGTKVPVSLIYNKKLTKINGKSPLYLYAYGCFGSSKFSDFIPEILSLLDRGIIYAIAHVRGGSELGVKWHEQAMQMKKQNTFDDFIAAAEYLIENKYTAKGKIIAQGGSAGGLIMGAVANQRPDLFNSVILLSPFLDVLGTLTNQTAKFNKDDQGEFGNPEIPEIYNYIKSYSPYENIKKQNYPNMLFYIGLNDNRVEYWQSLKSVAKLRALKTDSNKLYLKTELYTGHNGYYGTEAYYAERAFIYAFILNNLGIKY